MNHKARVIAFYLPQFHPIPENDKWWGKGFTEWTNVGRAKPLFRGHYQPRVPADLGYYDLRLPEVREAQAQMAREAGIEGFCYWHYWFGNGKQLLERPFNEVLASGKPDFPFCLGWANHSWRTNTWTQGGQQRSDMIVQQRYEGVEDFKAHFQYALAAFKDKRYITVDGKPLFVIFDPYDLPADFIPMWRQWATEAGLTGIHFAGYTQNSNNRPLKAADGSDYTKGFFSTGEAGKYYDYVVDVLGFDAVVSVGTWRAEVCAKNRYWFALQRQLTYRFNMKVSNVYDYQKVMKHYYVKEDERENVYPTLLPQWDRSPRSGLNGIYHNSRPEYFKKTLRSALDLVKDKQKEHQILFLKSWNEWAEGNYVEPDLRFGHGYLDVLKNCIVEPS